MPVHEERKLPRPVIRPALAADCEAARRIARAAYAPYVARMGREPAPMLEDYEARAQEGALHVLEAGGAVAGFAVILAKAGAVLLDNVAVAPEAQGQGYGRMLVEFAEIRAASAGAAELELYTNEAMHENLALYARLGFVETRRAEENGYRRVFMSKKF